MHVTVEPRDGPQLDRLITALLNATGVVKRALDVGDYPSEVDGAVLMGLVAERLRDPLAVLAEHRSDRDLTTATEVLAETTVLVAGDLGLGDCFFGD
jgi:hypothetical protein